MKEYLKSIAEKYQISSAIKKIDVHLEDIDCKIGFLGEFSSGKSTLINSLIGKKVLPAMVNPTSKSLIEIIPKSGIHDIEYYRVNDDGFLSTISAFEFGEIALGESSGSAALFVPESESLQSGFRLIDTPGFTALDKADADIAYGVLPQLDGIVICVDANKGALPKTVTDFIAKPHVMALFERIVIVITFAATKGVTIKKIAQEIKKQMTDLASAAGKASALNPVIVFDGEVALLDRTDSRLQQLLSALRSSFYDKKRTLQQDREKLNLQEIAISIKSILEDSARMVNYDTPELNDQEEKLEKGLKNIEREIKTLDETLEKLERKIENQVRNIVMQFKPQFNKQKADGISDVFTQMVNQINIDIDPLIAKHLDGFVMPNTLQWGSMLEIAISSIEKKVDIGKTIATALIAVAAVPLTGGGSVAAGAEAGAGAGLRLLSKKTIKEGAKVIAKEGVKEGAKLGSLKKVLPVLSEIFKAINPAELAGDIAEAYLKENTIDNILAQIPQYMAGDIIESFREEFDSQLIKPAQQRIADQRESLSLIRSAKMIEKEQRDAYKKQIRDDIKTIQTAMQTAGGVK